MAFTYDLASADAAVVTLSRVRLLLVDIDDATHVFEDAEIDAFLALARGGNVKRAAAIGIDANATDQVLASKVLRTQDVTTDGAKIADAMRKHAAALRQEADEDDANDDDGAFFEIGPFGTSCTPELTGTPTEWCW